MNMLFVEDDIFIRKNYKELLKSYFNNVFEASDGTEGLKIFQEESIDFILADIEMQNLNGIEMIKEIRKSNKDIPIIIMTAYDSKTYLFESIPLNLVNYLVKPVKYSEFIKSIKSILELINVEIHLINGFVWNKSEKVLFYNDKEVHLTSREKKLFGFFCNKSLSFSLERAFDIVYPLEYFNDNKIRMIIKRIRNKTSPEIIVNKYHGKYKFNIMH